LEEPYFYDLKADFREGVFTLCGTCRGTDFISVSERPGEDEILPVIIVRAIIDRTEEGETVSTLSSNEGQNKSDVFSHDDSLLSLSLSTQLHIDALLTPLFNVTSMSSEIIPAFCTLRDKLWLNLTC